MIPILRRFVIIAILFSIILFIQSIQVATGTNLEPKTLAVLGFLILASFTTGEIFSLIKLPRVIGYLLIGIVFGPYSTEIFSLPILKVFNLEVVQNLSLINTVALGAIALTAGLELKLKGIKKSLKSILLILGFKTLAIFILVPLIVYLLAPFIPFLAAAGWKTILAAGILISVISMGTSIELTLVVADEMKAKGKFIDLILSTAIVKDVLVILLMALGLTISVSLLNPAAEIKLSIFSSLALELFLSVLVGLAFGGLLIAYVKYIAKEMLLFILAFIVIASEISIVFHLETLIVFVSAGFLVQNFSEFGDKFHHPLQKLSLPIFVIFFTVAGAAINIISVRDTILIGIVIVIVRSIAMFLSVRYAAKITKEEIAFQNYGWMGFLSIGGLMLGLAILIEQKLPGFGTELKAILTTIVALNIFLGPILLKVALSLVAKPVDETENSDEPEKIAPIENKTKKSAAFEKFREPALSNPELNKSLFLILVKLNDVLKVFDRKFIYSRAEESIELVISVSEKYTDDFLSINKLISVEQPDPIELKELLIGLKSQLAEFYLDLCRERKSVEKNILKLEPLINDLFNSLVDLTDGLKRRFDLELEDKHLYPSEKDKLRDKIYKGIARLRLWITRLFDKEFKLHRSIEYKNLAKYFLVGKSASEILETVNLVGAERLTTLKKIHTLSKNYFDYLNELIELVSVENENGGLDKNYGAKIKELHSNFTNEISIYRSEIQNTTGEISARLTYALANPFNQLLDILEIAGTYKFNSGKYKYSNIFKQSEADKDQTFDAIRYWVNFYLGYLGIIEKESYLHKIKYDLTSIVDASLITISKEINSNLRKVGGELRNEIEEFRKALASGVKEDDFLIEVNKFQNKYFGRTIKFYTQHLEHIKRSKKLNLLLEKLMSDFSEVSSNLPDKIDLLEDSDFRFNERIPEFEKLKPVHLKNIAKSIFEQKLLREIGEINELLVNHLNLTIMELRNLYSIVTYHFKSAENEFRTNTTADSKLALEFLISLNDKLEFRVEELSNQIDQLEKNINFKILEKVESTITELDKYISSNSLLKANVYLSKETHKRVIFDSLGNAIYSTNRLLRKYRIISIRFYRKYFRPIIKRITGRLTINISTETGLESENIFFNDEKTKKLPFLYRKLFDGTTIESDDFFVQSDALERKIKQSIENFNTGKFSSTILIGEPGSGKNTLINSIISKYLIRLPYVNYEFKSTITTEEEFVNILAEVLGYNGTLKIEELILSLNDRSNKRVIILENIGRLFFKKINGYEAIKAFSYLISSTSKNILWICSIGKHPWTFINNSFELDRIFFNKIDISKLHRNDIRNIILNRHSVTGYTLVFKMTEIRELKNKLLKSDTVQDEQKELQKNFFDKLEEFSEGNIISGMYYWLQSIREVKDNTLIIEPPQKIQFAKLTNLEDIYMLTLSEILVHETLSDVQHSQLFDVDLEVSREILGFLAALNILYIDQIEFMSNRYFLNKSIFKLVEKELIRRNMI